MLLEQTSLSRLFDAIPETICLSQDLLAATLVEDKCGGQSLEDSLPQVYGECFSV